MTFNEYIGSIVGEKAIYIADGEMIDESDDYRGLINDLFELRYLKKIRRNK